MRIYYQAGNGDEHRHRTLAGAQRCAARWWRENRVDLDEEAAEHGLTPRQYRATFIALEPVGVVVEIRDAA